MKPYINEYFRTLSRQRQERVSALLEEARVGKEQLDAIVTRLKEDVGGFNTLVFSRDAPNRRIDSTPLVNNLRDISIRLEDMYEVSNLIATLLNSHGALLASDIKAIEDQLTAMEKMAQNSAFLLADAQAYDYAHLEPFSDELNRDTTLSAYPDRAGTDFTDDQKAFVRADEGILTLPQSIQNGHGLSSQILKSNVSAFVVNDSPLNNALTIGNSTGWSMTVAAAGAISSGLQEANGIKGAQVLAEFKLSQPSPCAQIKLVPYADMPVEILQITTYKNENDSKGKKLLNKPRKLDRPVTFNFPMQAVERFTVLINQSVFKRANQKENRLETLYARDIKEINKERLETRFDTRRLFHIRKLERAVQSEVLSKNFDFFSTALPSTQLRSDRGPMNPALLRLNRINGKTEIWREELSKKSRIIGEVLKQRPYKFDQIKFNDESNKLSILSKINADEAEQPVSQMMSFYGPRLEANFNYYYTLGLNYIGIGVDSPRYKGVFVSQPLPSVGDIGEVRIKAGIDNYEIPNTDRFSVLATSVELSVSNSSDPSSEDDWIPILPMGANRVEGERLFFNEHGLSKFRFPAYAGQVFVVYRNGYWVNNFKELQGLPGEVVGVKIDPALVAPDDIFTCDYYPVGNPTVVNFSGHGFEELPLVSAHDSTGSGERFYSTADRNTVKLSYHPYIDPKEAKEDGYSPIVVMLDSGPVAFNLTDYKYNKSVPLPADNYYYIHSGNTLLFNKPIKEPFRVYYQYLQNNMRFRVVLRCNSKDYVSPNVDFVHVKAKTRHPDVRNL